MVSLFFRVMKFGVLVLGFVVVFRAFGLDSGRFLLFFQSPADSPPLVSGQGPGNEVAI